jgi:hypothetical protein
MKAVRYEFYEPNKGYETIQADIFNQNTGGRVTGKEIEERILKEKKDPRLIRYAFDETQKPLAYIQASQVTSNVYFIGYPWGVASCPTEVQEKLFSDLLAYLRTKNPKEIQYWIQADWKEVKAFFISKGFKRKITGLTLKFDVRKVSEISINNQVKYKTRLATASDLDSLIELGSVDKELQEAGLNKEFFVDYFTNKVLKDGHCLIVSEKDIDIIASAPLIDETSTSKRVILRFTATRPGYNGGWPILIREMAKECIKAGWEDIPLQMHADEGGEVLKLLSEFQPSISESYSLFTLNFDE